MRWDFDAGFLTTDIAEAGSLGARRTPKGYESCLRVNQPQEFHCIGVFFLNRAERVETCSIELA